MLSYSFSTQFIFYETEKVDNENTKNNEELRKV
jgi:hypothetical protein